jgi:hypothetical protein
MKNPFTHKIALFTIAVGKDPVYFNSVRRYFFSPDFVPVKPYWNEKNGE